MHGAPSVSYPVGRSPFLGRLLAGAWLAGAAACVAWAVHGATAGAAWVGAIACTGAGAGAARWWWCQPAGLLAWDGEVWSWAPGDGPAVAAGRPSPVLDFQRSMLLQWRGAAGPRWLWLDRARLPARWDALRRAVYSPAPA